MARALLLGLTVFAFASCEDTVDPATEADIMVNASTVEFSDVDVNLDASELISIVIRNDGVGTLSLTAIELTGSNADQFALVDGGVPTTVGGGESHEILLAFEPDREGVMTAELSIDSDDRDQPSLTVLVMGRASRYQHQQVDRMGIPALNTVFNHPSGIAGFDKTAYNRATPADDLATYTDQFEVVLGAVGNADPAATAALLLPDELPVSLGVAVNSFATLTGRALDDDAVDVALFVTVGIAALQSDNVDANDKAFQATFPYVATPHN